MAETGLKIPEARFIAPDGKTTFVLRPHTPWKENSVYYSEREHRGKLLCPCCDEPVRFRQGTVSTAGSSLEGRRDHFALFPGGHHRLGCEIETTRQYVRPVAVDKSKGYRIHINTRHYSDAFNDEAGVYMRGADGRVIITDPDLRDREIYRIKSIDDLVALLERGEYKRLNDSKLIFRNQPLSWDRFFIRADKNGPQRFVDLLNRLEAARKKETYCAMVVETEKPLYASYKNRGLIFKSVPIQREHENNVVETIRPKVFMRNVEQSMLRELFARPGSYLVMGVPRLSSFDGQGTRIHTIEIAVDSLQAATAFDMREIRDRGLSQDVKKAANGPRNRPDGP